MTLVRFLAAAIALALGWTLAAPAQAGVVVVANRTAAKVDFTVVRADGAQQRYSLTARDVLSVPAAEKIGVLFDAGGTTRQYAVPANTIQFFVPRNDTFDLERIVLPGPADKPKDKGKDKEQAKPAAAAKMVEPPDSNVVVPVMLLVDQNEPAVRRIWEARLRERLKEASDIFERCCRVRFEVVAVETWNTDNSIFDFDRALHDFESKVKPAPASLAIGFTSRFQQTIGQTHLGGTRGPFYPYILLREWSSRVTKTERLEMLVHELGHYLGAVHSPEYDSVMRPNLGDKRSNARDFRIGFDPVNTFAIYLIGEEMRSRRLTHVAELHPATKDYLRGAYKALAEVLPNDPAAPQYLAMLDQRAFVQPEPIHYPKPLVDAAQVVVKAITAAAKENAQLPAVAAAPGGSARLSGDRLSEFYIRRAAVAAHALPAEWSAKAFLLGLGIGMDHSTALRDTPVVSDLCRRAESDQQRFERLAVLGAPTMHGQAELAEHFAVSAALSALAGPQAAETAGITRELTYSQLGHGFSFADLSADVAGAAFAVEVLSARRSLAAIATSFSVKDFMPEPGKLPDRIPWKDFLQAYGSAQDERFNREKQAIRQRVLTLPGHKNT